MMKFLVAVAMFTLIGFSLSSAASIQTGENETPKSMNDFKENLENLLHVVSEAIQENAKSDENMDLKDLIPEIKIHDEDDKLEVPNEEPSIETEEEEDPLSDEISTGEDDENANSKIYCSWKGRYGRCCKYVTVSKTTIRLRVCLHIFIKSTREMKIILRVNNYSFWWSPIRSHHTYQVCLRKGHLHLCFRLYSLYISSHHVRGCLSFQIHYRTIHYSTRIGCFYKKRSENKISTNKETPLHFIENQKHADDLFPIPKEMNQSNDVFGFDQ